MSHRLRPTTTLARTAGSSDEAGMVAGVEALAFGVLVFVFGTLVILNGWAVIDAKFATSAAAREAVRAVVQAPVDAPPSQLRERAARAAGHAFVAHGYAADAVEVMPSATMTLARCAQIELEAVTHVRSALVPGLRGPTVFRVASRHTELVDPFRSGLPEGLACDF